MPGESPERSVESRFLNDLYPDLSRSADVGKIALQVGIADTAPPVDKIGAYLEYLESIEGSDEQKKIIEEIIESSIREPVEPDPNETERRWIAHPGLAHEIEGFGYEGRMTPDKVTEVIRDRQRTGLRNWFDYLYGEEQEFPAWFRFYVATDLVRMSAFNQERSEFPRRGKNDNAMFPELDQEALAKTRETTMNILAGETPGVPEEVTQNLRFRNIYGHHYNNLRSIPEDELRITDGKWVTFGRGSDPAMLAETLSGRGSGWCLAVYKDAARYLKRGNVIVYFSENKDGETVNPRIAIATEAVSSAIQTEHIKPGYENKSIINEVRGILEHQELEATFYDMVAEKLEEMHDGDYIMRSFNNFLERLPGLRIMNDIEAKTKSGEALTDEELALLYGVSGRVEGFGNDYYKHVVELRTGRNYAQDIQRLFGCPPEEVAFGEDEITKETKIYVSTSPPQVTFFYSGKFDHCCWKLERRSD